MSPPFLGAPVVLDMFQGPKKGRYISSSPLFGLSWALSGEELPIWIICKKRHAVLLLLWTDILFTRSAVSGIRTKLKRRRLMPLPKMRMKVRKRERAAGSDSAPGVFCALTNPKHPPCHGSPLSQGSQADPFCLSFTRPSANFEMIFPFAGWQYQWWPRSWWFPWVTRPLLRLASVNCP